MIDISYKFYLQRNDVTYAYCINLVEVTISHQKLLLTYRELPTVALSYHVKIRELLTSGGVFTVNRYEYFMEKKIIIRTFCGSKRSKKNNIEPHQNFTCYKKTWRLWINFKAYRLSKVKKG